MREINEQFGIIVSKHTCYRARSAARKKLQGSLIDHYHLLPSYIAELKKVYSGSTFDLVLERETPDSLVRFKRLFICFDSLARGFLEGCRGVIGLDGCVLKTEMRGQLLCAVGKDGNNQMYPIAWAVRIVKKRELISDITDQLCPRIRELLEGNKLKSRTCTLRHAGEYQFEVTDLGNRFVVDLRTRSCSCRYWNIRGIPCSHAITCIHWMKQDPVSFFTDWLKKDVYKLAYRNGIRPLNGRNLWTEVEGNYVFPPLVKKQPGRPKQKRRIDSSEKELNGQRLSKKGVQMRCSLCHQVGHNRKTCMALIGRHALS
ncbi:uncharacterized protein LOC144707382 [Wolffia australiana]